MSDTKRGVLTDIVYLKGSTKWGEVESDSAPAVGTWGSFSNATGAKAVMDISTWGGGGGEDSAKKESLEKSPWADASREEEGGGEEEDDSYLEGADSWEELWRRMWSRARDEARGEFISAR